jgi:hypothetical protein
MSLLLSGSWLMARWAIRQFPEPTRTVFQPFGEECALPATRFHQRTTSFDPPRRWASGMVLRAAIFDHPCRFGNCRTDHPPREPPSPLVTHTHVGYWHGRNAQKQMLINRRLQTFAISGRSESY